MTHTYLLMVHEIKPWQHMIKYTCVSGVSRRYALHIRGKRRLAIQGFSLLDLIHHFSHIHFYFTLVFPKAIKTIYPLGYARSVCRHPVNKESKHCSLLAERSQSIRKPAPTPRTPDSRIIGANPPRPTCDGAILSHSNIKPGPKAPRPAPAA